MRMENLHISRLTWGQSLQVCWAQFWRVCNILIYRVVWPGHNQTQGAYWLVSDGGTEIKASWILNKYYIIIYISFIFYNKLSAFITFLIERNITLEYNITLLCIVWSLRSGCWKNLLQFSQLWSQASTICIWFWSHFYVFRHVLIKYVYD